MNHKDAKHFTWDQRLTLERMLKKGFTKAAIASALGKCERSIYYEINRGLCVHGLPAGRGALEHRECDRPG